MLGLGSCFTTSKILSNKQQLASVTHRPSTSSSHLRLLYSSGRVAPGKTQVGADFGLHHPANSRACKSNMQLQAMLEYHLPAHVQLTLHRGQKVVVSGHSQCLQLTGLGKSLPLTCQQQSRLNYKKRTKKRTYSAYTKGAP